MLHDGYTDLLYLLLPVWQREFGFSFALTGFDENAVFRALSLFQIPAARLARRMGQAAVLSLGTLLIALAVLGYGLAPSPAILFGLLLMGGIGAAVQHPLASNVVASAYGSSRMALGTYNFFWGRWEGAYSLRGGAHDLGCGLAHSHRGSRLNGDRLRGRALLVDPAGRDFRAHARKTLPDWRARKR